MRWFQPDRQVPPAINPTDANGDYRLEYIEWLESLPVETWDDIRNCLEAGVCDYVEWDGDKDGFIIRLFADKKESGDGFDYIFSVTTHNYDDDGHFYDADSADMHTEHWHLAQACAFMWQSQPTEWGMVKY